MTDVADRHWGQSLVRAPTAKDAAGPRRRTDANGAPSAPGRRALARATRTAVAKPGVSETAVEHPTISTAVWDATAVTRSRRPAAADITAVTPTPTLVRPTTPPAVVVRWPLADADDGTPQARQVTPTDRRPHVPIPVELTAVRDSGWRTPESEPVEPAVDPALARLARGVQDCARALTSLASRLDGLERRIELAARTPSPPVPTHRALAPAPAPEGLEARVRALEGMAADHVQTLDQRIRKLETLPASVGRLQKDTAWLADLATTRRLQDSCPPTSGPSSLGPSSLGPSSLGPSSLGQTKSVAAADLAPVYDELDAMAELVSSHHLAATQSLERVRTLERAVLEMRRHLERKPVSGAVPPG